MFMCAIGVLRNQLFSSFRSISRHHVSVSRPERRAYLRDLIEAIRVLEDVKVAVEFERHVGGLHGFARVNYQIDVKLIDADTKRADG